MKLSLRRNLARSIIGVALAGMPLRAQTPLDETPPQWTAFTPAIVYAEGGETEEGQPPYPITLVGKEGTAAEAELGSLGESSTARGTPAGEPRWRPARRGGNPVIGAIWKTVPLRLEFEVDPESVDLPQPRFEISRLQAERFAILGRVLHESTLTAAIRIDASGQLDLVSQSDSSVHALLRDFFDWIRPGRGPHFEAARDRVSGQALSVTGSFVWDLGMVPRAGVNWATAVIAWEELTGDSAVLEVNVFADGAGGVSGAYPAHPEADEHPDLPQVLATALALPFSDASAGTAERWTLVTNPRSGSITRTLRHPLERVEPAMLHAPRPEYPRRLWRRGPEGFVYIRFVITRAGETAQIEVIEATEADFGRVARETVREWRFEPMKFDGEAIASEVIMTLPFRLSGRGHRG